MRKIAIVFLALAGTILGFGFGLVLAGVTDISVGSEHYASAVATGIPLIVVGAYLGVFPSLVTLLSFGLPIFFIGGMIPMLAGQDARGDRATLCVVALVGVALVANIIVYRLRHRLDMRLLAAGMPPSFLNASEKKEENEVAQSDEDKSR